MIRHVVIRRQDLVSTSLGLPYRVVIAVAPIIGSFSARVPRRRCSARQAAGGQVFVSIARLFAGPCWMVRAVEAKVAF